MMNNKIDWLAIARKHGYALPDSRMLGFVTELLEARIPAAPVAKETHQHRYITYPDGSQACEFCSAAPVVAEGLTLECLEAVADGITDNRPDTGEAHCVFCDSNMDMREPHAADCLTVRATAFLAAHPVAGSPAEAVAWMVESSNTAENYVTCDPKTVAMWRTRSDIKLQITALVRARPAAAEPMPVSEARATAYDVLGLIAATTTDADTAKIAADNMKQFSPIAAPVPASEAASVPEGFVAYVRANYNGVVDIHRPEWHAERLWKAAMFNLAAPAAPTDKKG